MENLTEKEIKALADAALSKLDQETEEPDKVSDPVTITVEGKSFEIVRKDPTTVGAINVEQAQKKEDEPAFEFGKIRPQGIKKDDVSNFSFAKALSACWRRNWTGAEFEKEILVETKALTTDDDSAGGFLVQDILLAELIPELYAQTVVRELGATVYTMSTEKMQIPRMSSSATAYWLDQSTQKTEAQPGFEMVTLDLRECIGLVPVHERLLKFSSMAIETIVRQDLMKQLALAEDQAFIRGTGGVQPLGLYYQPGVGGANLGSNGVIPDQGSFTDAMYAIELLNGTYSGWAMHPRTLNTVRTLTDGNGRPLYYDAMTGSLPDGRTGGSLFGMPLKTTTQIPINLTVGGGTTCSYVILANWSSFAIGEAGAIELAMSRDEKFSYDQVLIRAVHYVDGVPKQPEEFYLIKAVLA